MLAALGAACAGPGAPSPLISPPPPGTPATIGQPATPLPFSPTAILAPPRSPTVAPTAAPTQPPAATGPSPTASPAGTPAGGVAVPPEAASAVESAKQDLAKRIGVAVGDVRVLSVTAVEWPTSALGCPKPGMAYAQVITPGYRIVLAAGGKQYEYHSDRGRNVILCEQQ